MNFKVKNYDEYTDKLVYEFVDFIHTYMDSKEVIEEYQTSLMPYRYTKLFTLFDSDQCLYTTNRDTGSLVAYTILENNKLLKIEFTNPYNYGSSINVFFSLYSVDYEDEIDDPMNLTQKTSIDKLIKPISIEQILERSSKEEKHILR